MNRRGNVYLVALVALCVGCVNGSPVAPLEPEPAPVVLNELASLQADTVVLLADSTFRAKAAGSRYWTAGRYWFTTTVVDTNRLCAQPNAVATDDYVSCSVWEPQPGRLMDPFSAFLRDGAVKQWDRIPKNVEGQLMATEKTTYTKVPHPAPGTRKDMPGTPSGVGHPADMPKGQGSATAHPMCPAACQTGEGC